MPGEWCVDFTLFCLSQLVKTYLSKGGKKSQGTVHSFIFSFLDSGAEKLIYKFGSGLPGFKSVLYLLLSARLGTPLSPSSLDFLIYLMEIIASVSESCFED